MPQPILWSKPTHDFDRSYLMGRAGKAMISLSGPRRGRGTWSVRLALKWPHLKPVYAAISFDVKCDAEGLIGDAMKQAERELEKAMAKRVQER